MNDVASSTLTGDIVLMDACALSDAIRTKKLSCVEAVARAPRMLPVADGSDHAGSLRNPAAFSNVLGLRPCYGRVPSNPEEVFLPQLGVAGPMARKVADLAQLLAVQAGYDPRVP